ncbi:MAG: 50S ribosomal protein L24 [Anaerolineales bacterium]|nr:50S ribosomal protein L24 [Anaerolineales bacterium]
MNIKKADTVEVIAGKDRGKRGEVLRVLPGKNRVIVQGLNLRKKHQKARPGAGGRQLAPEIVTFEGSMDAANVMVICPKCGERIRVRHQRAEDGKAARVCPECENKLDRA